MYLPAAFIYQDLKEVKFLDDVIRDYRPTGDPYQVFTHESGNKVMKYSIGQSVMYAPFFAVAHAWATASPTYPADGFSFPYQFMISMGSLVVSFLGLFWLMLVLRHYFSERAVALTLFLIVFGTNYLNYAAIDGAMTHNNVFSLYALLLLTSHAFYVRATWSRALLIGGCLGLMALTRPTEIIAAIIPLLWGLEIDRKGAIGERIKWLVGHWPKLLAAAAITLAIGSVQLLYWRYVSGDWLVYSYQDQGFDWLSPHLNKGFFSYKAGWLIYTPLMVFGLLGFWPLFRQRDGLFSALFIHALLFIYVAFSWSVWWYGGSLGQRTMVQEYAVLAFPLAAFVTWVYGAGTPVQSKGEHKQGGKWLPYVVTPVLLLFVWHSLYYTHQAHLGGLYKTEQMNNAYFWRTLYKFEKDPADQLRLDTPEFFTASPGKTEILLREGFDDRSPQACGMDPISGAGSLCLRGAEQNSPNLVVDIDLPPRTWLRARVQAKIDASRGNRDNHAQMIIAFRRNGVEVKKRLIRMHRLLNYDWDRELQIDSKVPDEGADQVVVSFWNGGSTQPAMLLDDLVIERLYE